MNDMQMAREIAGLVSQAGGKTYLVGGIVRDSILGKENKDVDIEIHGIEVKKLEEILQTVGQPLEMGASFGVFGLKGYDIDIAMPRKEEKTGKGHKDFKVDVDPYLGEYKAAKRRDFTINALMQDVMTGEIVDNFGGRADLEAGVLRHVSDETFAEDPLRVLRGAQFAARFELEIAPETLEISKQMDLSDLASERVFGELSKALIKAQRPSIFFERLRQMDQLDVWFPQLKELIGLEQNPVFHPEGDVWNHTMRVIDEAAKLRSEANYPLGFMVAALYHDVGKIKFTALDETGRIRSIGHEKDHDTLEEAIVKISNEHHLKHYVHNMMELHMRPNSLAAQTQNSKAYFKLFDLAASPADLLLLAKADRLGSGSDGDYAQVEALLREQLKAFEILMDKPYVTGRDLIEAGLTPGKEFSKLLEYAHKLRLSGVDKDKALKQTLALYKE